MRLTRPTLASPLPLTCDSKDLPGNLLNNALQQDPTAVPGSETLAIGQFLLLPQNPVNIYLGETFSSYICVYSETKQIVYNISVKVSCVDVGCGNCKLNKIVGRLADKLSKTSFDKQPSNCSDYL